jgi:hypothetical protein
VKVLIIGVNGERLILILLFENIPLLLELGNNLARKYGLFISLLFF